MFVLDTNVISEMMRPQPEPRVVSWLAATPRSVVLLPSVVVAESLAGIEMLPLGKRRDGVSAFVSAFIASLPDRNILAFGLKEALQYAAIVAVRRRQGRVVKLLDAQIASIAAARNIPVVTRNVRDFEDCGVAVINPWTVAP